MERSDDPRLIRLDAHDDGVNRWEMARLRPAAALAGAVSSYSDYWEVTGGFTARRELPGIEPVLIVNLGAPIEIVGGDGETIRIDAGRAFVAATHVRAAISRSSGAQAGVHVHMKLATMRRLLGMPLDLLLDRAVALDTIAPDWGYRLGADLAEAKGAGGRAFALDDHLHRRLAAAPERDREIGHAVATLTRRPDLRIAELARDLGWSRKRLGRRFREETGVGPRMFRRLARFGRLVARIQSGEAGGWAGLAVDSGYFDQPHMLRDFRDFAGITPREFVARALPNMGGLIEA
jgi:AraC-like DNA-binding protein